MIKAPFVLGPRAHAAIDTLAQRARREGRTVPHDASTRIAAAVDADAAGGGEGPFRLGVRARCELALLGCAAREIDEFEAAVRADLSRSATPHP